MNKHEIYKLSVVRKYLTGNYIHIDTPSLERYKQTKTGEDLMSLLNEYLEDGAFLSLDVLDKILGNIESIQASLGDSDSLGLCQFFYDSISDLREAKYEEIEQSQWLEDTLLPLLNSLGINTSK